MKITVSLYTPKQKESNSTLSQVCFRVREKFSDLRARTELLVNPEFWDETIPGYKASAKLPKNEIKLLNRQIADITSLIHEQYSEYCDGEWLRDLIKNYLHPETVVNTPCTPKPEVLEFPVVEGGMVDLYQKFLDGHEVSEGRACCMKSTLKKLQRFELFQQKVKRKSGYMLDVHTFDGETMQAFMDYVSNEYIYMNEYQSFYNMFNFRRNKKPVAMSHNGLCGIVRHVRAFLNWCVKRQVTSNEKWRNFTIRNEAYGTPIYLTLEERDRILDFDLSGFPRLECHRDMFIFQCMIGCRIGDLYKFTRANIVDGFIEYYPNKALRNAKQETYNKVCRVPLNDKAKALLAKYENADCQTLFPCLNKLLFNEDVKVIAMICGINRPVTVIEPKTGETVTKPLYLVISTHTARKTFIANLYARVKDPDLIASMTGHMEHSKAFRRYRAIGEELKQQLVEMIN